MPYHRYVPGKQDRQNAIVPDTTSNQLGVLTAVVEDEDRGVAGEYVRAGSHFEFVPALGRRADGRADGRAGRRAGRQTVRRLFLCAFAA